MIDNPEYEKTKLYLRGTYYLDDQGQRASLYAHRTWHTGDAGRPNRDFGHTYTTLNAGYTNPISDRMTAQAKSRLPRLRAPLGGGPFRARR